MAQKYLVQLVDDLTNEPIAEGEGDSINFALDGVSYTIDLSDDNVNEFRGVMQQYIDAARKADVAISSKTRPSARPSTSKTDLKAVREWANSNGYTVSSRGRIPAEITEAYAAAN